MRLALRSKTALPKPGEPADRTGRLRRVVSGVITGAAGIALWAAIILAVALFVTPTKAPPAGPPSSGRATVKVTQSSFTDVDICSGCHWRLYTQWSGSMHSLANSDPIYVALYDLANEDTGGKAEQHCAASMCHTPAGFLAGENPFPHNKMSPIALRGVFCDFCHTVSRHRGIGDAAYVSSPGPVKRGPYKNAESPYHLTAYSPLHTSAEFCGMCHNVSNPISGLKLETTYDEWKRSPQARRGIVCQDCHMKPAAGKAAELAPRRSKVYSHRFTGANAVVPTLFGANDRRELAVKNLRSAARISVASVSRSGKKVRVRVRVSNVGAGHSLPTGVTELRQLWLALEVRYGGEDVYNSGAVDADGVLDPRAHLFHVVLADGSGRPVTKVWRGVSVLIDHRVPAGKSVIETFQFNSPPGNRLQVTARLLYRSAPQELVDELLPKRKIKIPVIEMTRLRTTI